jgi:hypothetical protein
MAMTELETLKRSFRSTVNDLENQGYTVVVGPSPSAIPFDLYSYRPHILATRGDEHLIIEIKTRGSHRSLEKYQEIAKIIGSHRDWRFMLSTVDEEESTDGTIISEPIDSATLQRMLLKLDALLETDNYDLALPYLWSVYMSGMRNAGRSKSIPMDVTSDLSVLNYMYSLGEISNDEYNLARKFLNLRKMAAHNLAMNISHEKVAELRDYVKQKLLEWNQIA